MLWAGSFRQGQHYGIDAGSDACEALGGQIAPEAAHPSARGVFAGPCPECVVLLGCADFGACGQDRALFTVWGQKLKSMFDVIHPMRANERRVHEHEIVDRCGGQLEEIGAAHGQGRMAHAAQGGGALGMDFNGIDHGPARKQGLADRAHTCAWLKNARALLESQVFEKAFNGCGRGGIEGQITGKGRARLKIGRRFGGLCGIGQHFAIIGGQNAIDLFQQLGVIDPQMQIAIHESSGGEIAALHFGLPRAPAAAAVHLYGALYSAK